MPFRFSIFFLLICLIQFNSNVWADASLIMKQVACKNGPYKDIDLSKEPGKIKDILALHEQWLAAKPADKTWSDYVDENGNDPKRANLCGAILEGASLNGKDLSHAILAWANLSGANLNGTKLIGAMLTWTNLNDADLAFADLDGVHYASYVNEIPKPYALSEAYNLDRLNPYTKESRQALSALRKAFKENSLREAERTMTYLIKISEEKDIEGKYPVEYWFNRVGLNWTAGYGLTPGHCLVLLKNLGLIMTVVYLTALFWPENRSTGLWAVWSSERIHESEGQKEPVRLTFKQACPPSAPQRMIFDPSKQTGEPGSGWVLENQTVSCNKTLAVARQFFLSIWMAAYFSLLSTFHFGWRDLNVGNWLARIQPREYAIRASGWVRVLSGLQSLISLYLIALWALTYFGRPFE